jgi:hypothetical protein
MCALLSKCPAQEERFRDDEAQPFPAGLHGDVTPLNISSKSPIASLKASFGERSFAVTFLHAFVMSAGRATGGRPAR